MSSMMAALPDIITLVYGFCFFVSVVENAIMPGTKAVRWELFENLDLSWNDVSAFCHSQDGHIATPNTRLALNGLGQQAAQWFSPWGSRPLAEFWIGLHSATAGAHPNVWEKDCSLQDGNIQLWAAGEPNFKDTDLCIRVYPGTSTGQLVWKTWKCSREFAVVCEYEQETKAVRWEFFKNLKWNWTDVYKFCHSRGGHMVTPKTNLTMHALGQQAALWFEDWQFLHEFWIGLYNCESSDGSPKQFVWEDDNTRLGQGATFWLPKSNEPDFLDRERCIRMVHLKGRIFWRTKECDKKFGVVCEYDQGNCTYEALHNKTLKPQQGIWEHTSVTDLPTCWNRCLDRRVNGKECVAAEFIHSSGLPGKCLMSLGDRLLETSDVEVSDRADSTVLLRRCFSGSVNSTEQNVLSDVLSMVSKLMSHDGFSYMPTTTVVSMSPSALSSLPLPTTPAASRATSSSVSPATLSIASTTMSFSESPATSPSALAATSSPVSQGTSSNMSQSTSSTPTAAVSSTSSLNKSSSVLPATSPTASLNTTSSSAAPATLTTRSLPISPDSSSTSSNTSSWVSQATSSIASLTSASASLTSSLGASPTTSPSVSPPAASVSTKSTASPIKPADLSPASTATSSTVPLITFLTGSSNTSSLAPEVTSLIGSSHQTSSLPPAPPFIESSNTSSSIASATSSPQPSRTSSFVPQTTSQKEPFAPQNTSSTESSNTPTPTSTSSTEFSNKSEQLPTTSISLAESSIAPSPLSPTSSTQGISLTTEHALNASATKLPTGTTTQKKCPCVCRFKGNGSLPSLANTPEDHRQQLLIPVKEMSKYRRSKTSVYVERKSNPVMSVAYIIFMCFLVLCILLCDLTRIRKCRSCDKNRRSRVGLSSVEKA